MENKKSYEIPLSILLWLLVFETVLSIIGLIVGAVVFFSSGVLDWFLELMGL